MRLHDENASFRFNQVGLRKFLGDLECEIMELVWQKAKPVVTVREIYDLLKHERQIAYTTVMTTMVRLAEKGFLRIVDKSGLANCYSPVDGKEEFIYNAVAHILDTFVTEFPEESKRFLTDWESRLARQKTSSNKKR
jgi:predicted transcriptional regulator